MEGQEQWITAAEALRLLAPVFDSEYQAKKTIIKRARAGVIRARAEPFQIGEEAAQSVKLPAEFWTDQKELALQNWTTGDLEIWLGSKGVGRHVRAFNVSFPRADIEKMIPAGFVPTKSTTTKARTGTTVFIGHGRSLLWRELKDFIKDRLHFKVDEFNSGAVAGIHTAAGLSQMLDRAAIAFLVMTAEDEQRDGTMRARENVVHEVGLFQGRLSFSRAIVVLEEGCQEFSNISGLGQIRFPKGDIGAKFEEVRRVLEREGLLPKG